MATHRSTLAQRALEMAARSYDEDGDALYRMAMERYLDDEYIYERLMAARAAIQIRSRRVANINKRRRT